MVIQILIFMWFLFMSIILGFSSSSLFFLWICLEINMMSFIPLMYSKNMLSTNSTMVYFLIQSTASSFYIFMSSIFFMNMLSMHLLTTLIIIPMLIKLGAAPFHIWFPQISEGLPLNSLAILLTIQKILPLYIISIFSSNMVLLSAVSSSIIGSFGGLNQFTLRKILAFSSISHLSWILSLLSIKSNLWILYLVIYSLMIFTMISIMSSYQINSFNFSKKNNNDMNLFLIVTFLSLGGMPPMVGFVMKWVTLKMIFTQIPIISIPLILSSLINLFFYIRLLYPSLLKNSILYKWSKSYFYKYLMMIIFQSTSIFLLISMI
uniref:NADH dehydrogenase subunit 2 n=1 Tax=Alectorobius fonsecai TaxID=656181 RepID=UPI002238C0F4|nr:NADH dehydrogenase subunit 2 [Alectorobius fonsecai]UYB78301.1 NADH dehydrogenase subunit 2 [Alectorobius fonsecai]UYL27210.1 NADH dehydrogenase subunit 2 [Alectorobius fonsecai]